MSAGKPMIKTIEEFKQTRWWLPTVRRYRAHLDICEALDCKELIESFSRFVSEVLQAPIGVRDDMLAMAELEPVPPAVRYRQYDTPTRDEQMIGVDRGRNATEGWERREAKRQMGMIRAKEATE